MFTTHLTDNSEAYIADGGEIVYAEGGNDQIYVIPVDDTGGFDDWDWDYFDNTIVHGGDGNDLIVGHNRTLYIDILYGDNGNDTIRAGSGDDKSYGGAGDDIIWTGDGEDYVDCGADDDTVYATEATNGDVFHGGSGYDVLYLYHTANESWNFSLGGGGSTYGLIADGFEELQFTGHDGVEVIEGGANTDWMWGGAGGDMLTGLGGDDGLWGQEGADILNGGDGDDHVDGGIDDDLLYGGNGADSLEGGSGNDSLRGDAGDDLLHGDDGNDTIRDGIGNDTVYGDAGDDTIRTGSGSDEVWGGSGTDTIVEETADSTVYFNGHIPLYQADTLHGGSGNDTIKGGGGHDDLYGDGDNDMLDGGVGDDLLVGGTGKDTLTGGTGADFFAWNSVTESQADGALADVITDFDRAAGDRIDLSAIDANQMLGGNQAFTFVGVIDFGNVDFTGAGQVGYFVSGGNTYILINTSVTPGTDFEETTIRVNGVQTVDASWFVL